MSTLPDRLLDVNEAAALLAVKPATLYAVAPEASTLFSNAYAPLLSALVAELGEHMSVRQLQAVLRAAGRRWRSFAPVSRSYR